ncbi:hypothetical protein DITRI_Ditri08aG0094700 [Diplodiscus trichospermus]
MEERKRFFSEARGGRDFNQKAGKKIDSTKDEWRASLFTIFINNLSRRIAKRALWEAFSQYGRVVDVFINFQSRKSYTYAFVRYRLELEGRRAIAEGNNRRIDGCIISVKKTSFGWKERKKKSSFSNKLPWTGEGKRKVSEFKVRDNRSYKEVLVGDKGISDLAVPLDNRSVDKADGNDTGSDITPLDKALIEYPIVVDFIFEAQENDIKWLEKVVIGRLKDTMTLAGVRKALDANNISCLLWNERFFKALVVQWGSYIRADYSTMNKERLDVARILVRVKSKLIIPSIVTIRLNGISVKIVVSIEEDNMQDSGIIRDSGGAMESATCMSKDQALKWKMNSPREDVAWETVELSEVGDSCSNAEFSLMLTEEELVGTSKQLEAHVTKNVMVNNFLRSDVVMTDEGAIVLNDNVAQNEWAVQIVNDLELQEGKGYCSGPSVMELSGPITYIQPIRDDMRIVTWNVRGLGRKEKQRAVRKLLRKGCGIGNVYAPKVDSQRATFWEELSDAMKQWKVPWCLVAISMWLDRFLLSGDFFGKFPCLIQKLWPRSLSNHFPLSIGEESDNWGPKPLKFFNHWLEDSKYNAVVLEAWNRLQREQTIGGSIWCKLREIKKAVKEWYSSEGVADGPFSNKKVRGRYTCFGEPKWSSMEGSKE